MQEDTEGQRMQDSGWETSGLYRKRRWSIIEQYLAGRREVAVGSNQELGMDIWLTLERQPHTTVILGEA